MTARLRELQDLVLAAERGQAVVADAEDPFLKRVADALRGLFGDPMTAAAQDVSALLAQGTLRCHSNSQQDLVLRVPTGPRWPSRLQWQSCGCEVEPAGAGHVRIRPHRWNPQWLDEGAADVVDVALREIPRRRKYPVPCDPLVTALTGHEHYVSPGQRAAVQAAFLSPPGSTLIINLPTGGGKTLAFQLPALASADNGALTLVIVPTVALAKDQEARFRQLLPLTPSASPPIAPLAYHGGLDDETKGAIRSAIRTGTIPILFASAEAAVGTLKGPLFSAAREGRLKLLAVDEAHIVTQWGQQFRPEFQSIAGLRQALLEACPSTAQFRTLLLTATLTEECCTTLTQLFGGERVDVVGEWALRSEPAFVLHATASEYERRERLTEALMRLPRPLVLYTTRRDHAEDWFARIRLLGFMRVRMVRGGDLSDVDGDEVLRQWRDGAIDIVIGTSAFGLGVDQQEVRSIVHACIPETIDRYYQEVGRGGRDGHASVALLVSTPEDVDTARNLANERLIGIDRAFERWEAMWMRRRLAPGSRDTYVLSLDERPPDIAEPGTRNSSWNLRTLVLMARAGLLTFAAHPPPDVERDAHESDADFISRLRRATAKFSSEVAVRIEDAEHSSKAHWDGVVHRTRVALRYADEKAFALALQLRRLERPLNDVLRDVYSLPDLQLAPPRLPGSCPVTRSRGVARFVSAPPLVRALTTIDVDLAPTFARALRPCTDADGRAWVGYSEGGGSTREQRQSRESVLRLLTAASAGGVVEFAVPSGLLGDRDWSRLLAQSPWHFLIRATDNDNRDAPQLQVPRLTILPPSATQLEVERAITVDRPAHILLLPQSVSDPDNHNRRLLDVVRHLDLDGLISLLDR